MKWYLIVIENDVEASVFGPFSDRMETLMEARKFRALRGHDRDGLHWLYIHGTVESVNVGDFVNNEMEI